MPRYVKDGGWTDQVVDLQTAPPWKLQQLQEKGIISATEMENAAPTKYSLSQSIRQRRAMRNRPGMAERGAELMRRTSKHG